jgi:dihydrofolate synthase/folylpolyglutamate synthase
MTYKETLEYLFESLPAYQRIGKAAYKADLSTSIALDKYFGSPHQHYKTVHIAGTNGKGSVSHYLSSVLSEAGLITGLYTSPHIRDFRERIRVNGAMIEEEYVVDFVGSHGKIFKDHSSSFFEMTVAMAFQYFKDRQVDIAIIETGMGGRLDSTNIINPLLSVITNIGLDHTQFLGSSKAKIAVEKAGIIKYKTPVVIGRSDPETDDVFISAAEKNCSPIFFAGKKFKAVRIREQGPGSLTVKILKDNTLIYNNLVSGLAGLYQIENIVTSLAALDVLADTTGLSDENILSGYKDVISNSGIEGRWQKVSEKPLVICDTAHNLDGISLVLKQLAEFTSGNLRFVLGFVNDKEIDTIVDLMPLRADYYLTKSSVLRSMQVNEMAEKFKRAGLRYKVFNNVPDAYESALEDSEPTDLIYVGGSTFIVADFLVSLK